MSITLAIPPDLVQQARVYAAAHGTTMSQMIRDYFAALFANGEEQAPSAFEDYMRIVNEANAKSPKGWKFNREECHERGSRK